MGYNSKDECIYEFHRDVPKTKAKKKLSNFETNFDKVSSEAFAKASIKPRQKLYIAGPWFDERANALMQMVKELFRQYGIKEEVSADDETKEVAPEASAEDDATTDDEQNPATTADAADDKDIELEDDS